MDHMSNEEWWRLQEYKAVIVRLGDAIQEGAKPLPDLSAYTAEDWRRFGMVIVARKLVRRVRRSW